MLQRGNLVNYDSADNPICIYCIIHNINDSIHCTRSKSCEIEEITNSIKNTYLVTYLFQTFFWIICNTHPEKLASETEWRDLFLFRATGTREKSAGDWWVRLWVRSESGKPVRWDVPESSLTLRALPVYWKVFPSTVSPRWSAYKSGTCPNANLIVRRSKV